MGLLIIPKATVQCSALSHVFLKSLIQLQFGHICYQNCCSFSLVLTDFAAAAVLITFGAVLGRASMYQIFVIAFLEIIFYSANEAINVYVYEAADVGGSMIIHTFGAYFGLACSIPLFRKKAKDHQRNSSVYHSDLFAMIGVCRERIHVSPQSSLLSHSLTHSLLSPSLSLPFPPSFLSPSLSLPLPLPPSLPQVLYSCGCSGPVSMVPWPQVMDNTEPLSTHTMP